ncbi:MAG TPA: hypothetical protein PKC59_10960 [Burkholderiaceae bacterium]|nr:hypothetical protein [Burkholderiaceae bacterium]HMX10939.1 hypothetical protein [Burkholderiaceae bacterium]HMZ02395.1 hypothetical protein [Burkholderiaceae bacterium]HNB47428.1 hypothetical protein [Burkholderiaceae bacterium]HNG82533.1 hypothetical protein [Burkholderiaceae bacterium]
MTQSLITATDVPDRLQRTMHIVYGLHALGLVIGAFGAASVVGSFLFGWPSIIAVILSYLKRDEARGTWLESHFAWSIRTFWLALGWAAAVTLVSIPLAIVLVGIATWVVGLFVLGLWAIYRVARGWLRLKDGLPMPQPAA